MFGRAKGRHDGARADRVSPGARHELDQTPLAARGLRWPWALLAAGLGAAGGAAVALLARRQLRADAPGAQEPHELRAVVDRPSPEPPA